MEQQERLLQELREIANSHKGRICIVKTNVDADLQLDFYETLQHLDDSDDNAADFNTLLASLCEAEKQNDLALQKHIIAKITITGTIEAFRFLENYINNCNENIKNWVLLACQQCQMFLESYLLDEPTLFFASGLGGAENRFRYEIVLKYATDNINEYQTKLLTDEINYHFKKNDSICEALEFIDSFIICTALVPITGDLVQLLNDILEEVNKYGNFVSEHFLVTNEKPVDRDSLNTLNFF